MNNKKFSKENEFNEFKESLSEKFDAGNDIVAIANKSGGTLIFGVKNNGNILGLSNVTEKTLRDLSQIYMDNIKPALSIEILEDQILSKSIIKIVIPKSSTPYHTFKGKAFIRIGSASKNMSVEEYQRRLILHRNFNPDYSSSIVSNTTMKDLDPLAIQKLRQLLITSGRVKKDITLFSDKQLLKDLNLLVNNKLTVAALILLGKESSLKNTLPYAEIRFGYKNSPNEIHNSDMEVYSGAYLLFYNDLFNKIEQRNGSISIPYEMQLVQRKMFDEETIREAVNNAVVHRDYSLSESSFVFQYANSIIIKSPGGLPEGITLDNIIDESRPRNKLIADVLFKCGFVEQFGNGVNLMFKNQLSLGKKPPNYDKSQESHVTLEINGSIEDIEFAKYVLRVAHEENKTLDDSELIVLHKIKNNKRVLSNDITNKLLDLNLIEKISSGKYILSRKYYSDFNRRAEFTIRAGLNKEERKMLIIKHLEHHKKGYMREFAQIIRDVSTDQIHNYLKELRDDDKKIRFIGNPRISKGKNQGYWELCS